jgi:hypothetical protein
MIKALAQNLLQQPLDLKITFQGGVGTAAEHNFFN